MKEEQLKLFGVPLYRKRMGPLYYVEIIESDGKKYIIWLRKNVNNKKEVKKIAAKMYNEKMGYDIENNILKFGKIKEMKKSKRRKKIK